MNTNTYSAISAESFRALVVDDDAISRHVAAVVLKRCGAREVIEADSGAAAMDWADRDVAGLDLVMCDLRMPQVDGLETLTGLTQRTRPKVLVLASAADPRLLRAAADMAARSGIDRLHTITKPVTFEKIRDIVALLSRPNLPADRWEAKTTPPVDCSTKIIRGLGSGQFQPFFQPRWDAAGRQPVAAEARLRWRIPGEGLFAPEAFLHIAQSTFLLDELVFGVLSCIAASCSEWHRGGHNPSVSVDVPLPFLSTSLPRRLEDLFTAHGASPEQLTLEVTEADWLQSEESVREILTRLRLRGFGLAIGRFGTRSMSAHQLLNAPITELKLAPALVRAAPEDPAASAAIARCVALADELSLKMVADGVETSRQLEQVFRLGCGQVQGSLLAPLMPIEEFEHWIARPSPFAATIVGKEEIVPVPEICTDVFSRNRDLC